MKNQSFFRKIIKLGLISSALLMVALISFIIILESDLPDVDALNDIHLQVPLRVFSADNKLIAEFGKIRRTPVTLDKVPTQLIDATLATEDKRFFTHSGVDFLGLARAAVVLVLTGQKREGGSTITMQVARNYFLTRKKTYVRKIKEILLAIKIDHLFSKDKILELYFNKVFYGQRAYGVATAAKTYYGKSLKELSLPQLAMLAGLPKAPSALNPLANATAAKNRRDHVLYRMYELNYIDQTTYEQAVSAPITAKYHGLKVSVHAPYIAEMVRQAMIGQYGKDVYSKGYNVYTTIDSKDQIAAKTALRKGLLAYDQRHGYRGAEQQFGQPTLDNFNNLIKKLRQIATVNTLKPAVVLSTDDNSAKILFKSGQIATISWQGMSWARKQILRGNQEYLGIKPNPPSDILRPGYLVRVVETKNHAWRLSQVPKAEAAIVALNPNDGAIKALTGGFYYYFSNFNRITQAMRQPGSAFKPFIYSAALAKGYTLATVINDAPFVMSNGGGENNMWRPVNDTRKFYGPTRLRTALNQSRNLVSIRLLQSIGIPYAIDYASRFGFHKDEMPTTLSLALGSATMTPLQLATGYATFANGGYKINPYFINTVVDYNKNIIYQSKPLQVCHFKINNINGQTVTPPSNCAPQVINADNAYILNAAMRDVIQHGTGRAALALNRKDLAGKTGTTNDKKDAWFSGFNTNLVATAWMGFDNPRPLYEYAAQSALPMWIDFMRIALKHQPTALLPEPSDIVTVKIDKKTGLLASANDTNTAYEVFRKAYVPTQVSAATNPTSTNLAGNSDIEQLY